MLSLKTEGDILFFGNLECGERVSFELDKIVTVGNGQTSKLNLRYEASSGYARTTGGMFLVCHYIQANYEAQRTPQGQ